MIVAIPEILREKLGPEGARALAELLSEAAVRIRGDVIEVAAGRFERTLAEELGKLRAEFHAALHAEVGSLRAEFHAGLHSEIGKLRAELHSEIGASEGRMIRWMFVFWIGQVGAILGILFVFFR